MQNYYIESFEASKLWGYRDIKLNFNSDVNIMIGPNGSGKTTVLNLLHSILSADLSSIVDIKFEQVEIKLRSFIGKSKRTVKVNIADDLLIIKVGQRELKINIDYLSRRRVSQLSLFHSDERNSGFRNFLSVGIDELTSLVPLVWLPVSRRSSETEFDDERRTNIESLDSIDLRLKELRHYFMSYHGGLIAQLAERYKVFERQVLSVPLYSKEHDQLKSIRNSIFHSLPTKAEKRKLLSAFESAGFLDKQMQDRIDEHFDTCAAAKKVFPLIYEGKYDLLKFEDALVIPLIGRTKDMVKYAEELEKDKETIFASLRHYVETVNSFLDCKSIKVKENGQLTIELSTLSSSAELNPRDLSSGEKQILVLLTEALLTVNNPIVYIADEPELSLHVTWQERLLKSLVSLGGQIQVIVATHSPDIVGEFQDKVIELGREN